MEHLRKLEESLLGDEVRASREKLDKLIHDSFVEIGYSGTTYTKTDILNDLPSQSESTSVCWSQDYDFITLASNLVLVMYREARMDDNGKLSRYAKRTSIWLCNERGWQLKFHQGTPTDEFEKVSN